MLPDYPKLKNELLKKLEAETKQEMRGEYGLLYEFPIVYSHEGHRYTYSRVDGSIHEMKAELHSSKVQLPSQEIAEYDYSTVKQLMVDAYRDMHNQISKSAFEVIDAVVQETGNVIDAEGGALTQEMFLEMLDRIDSNPDDRSGLRIIAHPETAEKLVKKLDEWSQDEAFKAKWQAIQETKRREWLDQESHRTLVD